MLLLEYWVDIPGYEGMYQVSYTSKIKSLKRIIPRVDGKFKHINERIIKTRINQDGYEIITLWKQNKGMTCGVHRIVMFGFKGLPPVGMEVCHGNGVRHDNRPANLRYGTHKENGKDMITHGNTYRGIRNNKTKLTKEKVLKIREMLNSKKYIYREIGDMFGVKDVPIGDIKRNKYWKWL